jgi:hypothetical protein
MKDPDKIWDEANKLKQDRYNWKMGKDFQDCNKEDFTKRMQTKYNYIFTSSSTMFKNLIEDDMFDMNKLEYMINLMRSMKDKKKTFETASQEVGKRFADEYIQPLVDKLDKEKSEKEEKKVEELE